MGFRNAEDFHPSGIHTGNLYGDAHTVGPSAAGLPAWWEVPVAKLSGVRPDFGMKGPLCPQSAESGPEGILSASGGHVVTRAYNA